MKCTVIETFKVKTSNGETELQAGQVITLPKEKALKLLNEGKVTPIEKVAYRIYSNILQAYLWVVADNEEMKTLRTEGIQEAVYTHKDISELKKLSKEDLKAIHRVKEVFLMSTVEEITNKVNQVN